MNAERAKKIVRADSDDLHDSRDRLQSSYRAVTLAKAGEVLADRCDELEDSVSFWQLKHRACNLRLVRAVRAEMRVIAEHLPSTNPKD